MRTEDIGPDNLESSADQSTEAGTFFNKYKPRQTADPETGNKFFRKYVVAQDAAPGEGDEPAGLASGPEYSEPEVNQRPARDVSAFTLITLITGLVGVAVLLGFLYTSYRNDSPHSEVSPQATEESVTGPESQPDEAPTAIELEAAAPSQKRDRIVPARSSKASSSSFRSLLFTSMLARAHQLEDMDRLSEAAKIYQDILNEFPEERSSQIALSRIQNTSYTRQRDESGRAAREAGLRKFRIGDYLGAEADLSIAVNAGRTDTATLYALGMSYLNLQEHAKAMATLTECIATSPDYPPALVGLAQANLYSGDKDQAVSLLSRALELGGGAEFTPAKIQGMINRLEPKETPPAKRARGYFFAYAFHRHSFPLVWCKGVLTINNSVVEFRSNKPSHSFRISATTVINAAQSGNELVLDVKGEMYRFTIEGKSVKEFLAALNP